jgi:hypothetical protein
VHDVLSACLKLRPLPCAASASLAAASVELSRSCGRSLPTTTRPGATVAGIERAVFNAGRAIPGRRHEDRVLFRSVTDGGRRLVVVARIVRDGVRPMAAWEE